LQFQAVSCRHENKPPDFGVSCQAFEGIEVSLHGPQADFGPSNRGTKWLFYQDRCQFGKGAFVQGAYKI
jgi:hypothetical protein